MTNPNSPKTNDGTVREDRTTDYGRFVPWLLLIIGLSILWFLKMNGKDLHTNVQATKYEDWVCMNVY